MYGTETARQIMFIPNKGHTYYKIRIMLIHTMVDRKINHQC